MNHKIDMNTTLGEIVSLMKTYDMGLDAEFREYTVCFTDMDGNNLDTVEGKRVLTLDEYDIIDLSYLEKYKEIIDLAKDLPLNVLLNLTDTLEQLVDGKETNY